MNKSTTPQGYTGIFKKEVIERITKAEQEVKDGKFRNLTYCEATNRAYERAHIEKALRS